MKYLNKPVGYLTITDFDQNGTLINPDIPKNKIVIIMIQANFCGYCTQAKPAFQEFAKNKNVIALTIQGDGNEKGEKELSAILNKIDPTFRGFPSYVAYKNGKYLKSHNGGRSAKDLEMFVKSLN
jgi:thiol-disulfide isomerase/thioredoxin